MDALTRQEESAPPVSWREGVHIRGTSIWCDARRLRDVCFVSRADAIRSPRHGQLIATAATLRLLSRADPRLRPGTALPVPYGRPFSLGAQRLELFRSGTAIGSASLAVDIDGSRVVYAGDVTPRGGGLGGSADLRPCDTLVLGAEYGHPRFAFPDVDELTLEVAGFCRKAMRRAGAAVLLVRSASKGIDVATRLAALGVRMAAHRSIHHASRRLEDENGLRPVHRFSGRARPGQVLLWLTGARDALERVALPPGSSIALLSGTACHPDAVRALRVDAAFAWSDRGDHRDLLEYARQTGAEHIFVTGPGSEPLAESLQKSGRRARAIGPPRQMSLF
jgi:putative mRNA 3-end processing factor